MHINDKYESRQFTVSLPRHGQKSRGRLDLVVVDYLQLLKPENPRQPRHEQVGVISRRLKFLARELAVPVVVLAQLNRAAEGRADQTPRLSDLRESGSLEQDADAVLLLHRLDEYGKVEVVVAKNRNGRTGEALLTFNKALQRFENDYGSPFGA